MAELNEINDHDRKIIGALEGVLGVGLEQIPEIDWGTLGYVVNEAGGVAFLGLRGFDIDDKKLKEMAEGLGSLTSLAAFDLSGNLLSEVSGLGSLTSLTILDLSENQLTELSGLDSLTSLTMLNLCNNNLKNIPSEFFQRDWPVYWDPIYPSDGLNLYDNPLEVPPIEIVRLRGNGVVGRVLSCRSWRTK